MVTSKKYGLLFGTIYMAFLFFFSLIYFVQAEQGTLQLEIKGIGIRHGTPNNANLGTIATSIDTQEFTKQFDDYFWIEDLEGYVTGHYTTIQCNGVHGPADTKLTGVYLKAGNISPTRIQGLSGNVLIAAQLYEYTSIIKPITYIYKPTDIHNIGISNKYGDKPWIKIIIPGSTPPGIYTGTIVFSFYSY